MGMIRLKKELIETVIIVCLAILATGVSVNACSTETQTELYNTVKDAVVNTYSEASYNVILTGEDNEVTEEDVVDVICSITEDYSSEYDIEMTGIKECQKNNLEGYEVSLDVKNLSFKERIKFTKDLKALKRALKKKGKTRLRKVGVINKWVRKNITINPKSKNDDIYSVFTSRTATKIGIANLKCFLIKECCGYRTRVVKYNGVYCTQVKLGRKTYIIE